MHYVINARQQRVTIQITLIVAAVIFPSLVRASQFYVTPTGLASGDGSTTNPWNLQTALEQPLAVQPGDTICLAAGTYRGRFSSTLKGTASAHIVVKPCVPSFPPAVVIDGFRTTLLAAPANTAAAYARDALTVASATGLYVGQQIQIDEEQLERPSSKRE